MNTNAILSKREDQMITGLVLGHCKKEIASELYVSPRTVEATIRNAMAKVDVKKSTDLVVFWFVKHFSIPIEALPKSITAFIFLMIWLPYEFTTHGDALRTNRARRTRTEQVRTRSGRRNELTLEI